MKQYNGVPLDGRAMNIQLATSDLPQQTTQKVTNRIQGNTKQTNRPRGGGGGSGKCFNL